MEDWEDYWIDSSWNDWDYSGPADKACKHEWIEVQLIISKVYDCKHCGIKKEDWEKNK